MTNDRYGIIETDNHGGDYPDETFLKLPPLVKADAQEIANVINKHCANGRFWRVVSCDYQPLPAFEP